MPMNMKKSMIFGRFGAVKQHFRITRAQSGCDNELRKI
jgi:hypothetical protein